MKYMAEKIQVANTLAIVVMKILVIVSPKVLNALGVFSDYWFVFIVMKKIIGAISVRFRDFSIKNFFY